MTSGGCASRYGNFALVPFLYDAKASGHWSGPKTALDVHPRVAPMGASARTEAQMVLGHGRWQVVPLVVDRQPPAAVEADVPRQGQAVHTTALPAAPPKSLIPTPTTITLPSTRVVCTSVLLSAPRWGER